MLDLDPSVALALVLSVASAILCVGYGLSRWNADDDPAENERDPLSSRADPDRVTRNHPDGA